MMELGQLGDGAHVALHGAVGVTAELQVVDHALAKQCHEILSEKGLRGADIVLLSFSIAWQGKGAM
jgi:hypothetical protein